MDAIENDEDKYNEDDSLIDYADVIENNYLLLVNHLQLDRHYMFSYLRSKSVLDEEDVELILNTGNTRQKHVSCFLDLIKRKGTSGLNHFIDALQYEHPSIYEKITGKKANPLSENLDLESNTSNSIDQNILYKRLVSTMQELQCLNQVHQKIKKDKFDLEKQLIHANNSLKMKEQEMLLREKMHEKKCNDNSELEILDQDHLVTVLQGKLLEFMEEKEQLRKELMDITLRFNECDRENMKLKYQCDLVKRDSFLLQKKMEDRDNEMNSLDKEKLVMKRSLVDIKNLREKNIGLKKEIEEFRKYGEVLNQKYKLVVKAVANSEDLNNKSPCETLSKLTDENTALLQENESLSKTNKQLVDDLLVKTQLLKSVESEWNASNGECNKLKDELVKAMNELDESKVVNHSHLTQNIALNKRYDDICEKLNATKLEVKKQKAVVMSFKVKQMNSNGIDLSKHLEASEEEKSNNSFVKRSSLEVLNSIKRNLRSEFKDMPKSPSTALTFEQINLLHMPISSTDKEATLPLNGLSSPLSEYMRKSCTCSSIENKDDKDIDFNSNNNEITFRPRSCHNITNKTQSF